MDFRMLGWFLNLIYLALLIIASPLLIYRRIVQGKYRDGWKQKLLGLLPHRNENAQNSLKRCIWFHGVSVGEVLQIESLIQSLSQQKPNLEIVITTTTQTGFQVAKEKYAHCIVCYFPLDFTWAVKNAMLRIHPDLIVLVELELWPNFVQQAKALDIPLMMINARMSENSYRGYRKIRSFVASLLQKFGHIAAQNDEYAQRLIALGANPKQVSVTGSIKFDQVDVVSKQVFSKQMQTDFGLQDDDVILMAGSTHAPEEAIVLDVYQQVKKTHPTLRLMLAPRHAERFDDVANLIKAQNLTCLRRSEVTNSVNAISSTGQAEQKQNDRDAVFLLDTLGELSAAWGLATIAFVGGSLTNRGGQNMIEPAAWGKAVLFGPNTKNFKEAASALVKNNAAQVVEDRDSLQKAIQNLLNDGDKVAKMGENGKIYVAEQRGAGDRTIQILLAHIP